MTGYVRVDTSNNIADGNVINAADLDNEFDGVQAAFNASTGHTHGGGAGEGAPITALGPVQDVTVSSTLMAPKTTNTVDVGSSSLKFKDLYIAGTAYLPTVSSTTVNATTVDTTNIEVTNIKAKDGTSAGSIADSTGVVTLASAVLTTADINGGTLDNVTIGGSTAAAASFTTIGATGVASFAAGSASAPAITRTGDTNTGVFFPAADTIALTTGGTERARVDSSGNLVVGATSSGGEGGITLAPNADDGAGRITFDRATTTASSIAIVFENANTTSGQISYTNTATTYATSSDYRLKENIAPMTGALATVAQLKPCTYTWKQDGSEGQGFIAHELQEIVPQAVTGEKDAVKEDGSMELQGIDTSFLVATLTAAIQEQQAIITQLQADVAALKGN